MRAPAYTPEARRISGRSRKGIQGWEAVVARHEGEDWPPPAWSPVQTAEEFTDVAWRAAEVLRRNDFGTWTRPAPHLYPHQWSWDSAFIAIGLAHLDTRRAARELRTLFDAQWATDKVPHIVLTPTLRP